MITRIPLLLSRRSISTSAARKDSLFARIRDFFFAVEKTNFDKDIVARAYKWDKISEKEWKLIHRDLNASKVFVFSSIFVPSAIIGAVVLAVDVTIRPEQDRFFISRKFIRDFKDLGNFAIFPLIAVIITFAFVLRMHSLRVLRIYQNRTNVDEYIAVRPKYLATQEQAKFRRNDTSAFYYGDEMTVKNLVLNTLLGNVQIRNRKHMVTDDCFVGNNYRSYMLNETSVPPLLTEGPPKIK